jgi:hypothetical protein
VNNLCCPQLRIKEVEEQDRMKGGADGGISMDRNDIPMVQCSPAAPSPPKKTRRRDSARSPLSATKIFSDSFVWARRSIEFDELDLNSECAENEFSHSPIQKIKLKPGGYTKAPWNTGDGPMRRDGKATQEFYSWASSCTAADREM